MERSPRPSAGVLLTSLSLVALLACIAPKPLAAQPVPPTPVDTIATSQGTPLLDLMDIAGVLIGRKVEAQPQAEPRPGLSIALLPSVGYNPSYGTFVGISVAMGGWLGDPKTTGVSSGSAGASYSTTGQISVQMKTDFFLPDNAYDLKGDWRYLDTSQETFGLGPVEDNQGAYPMDFKLLRFHETVYRGIKGTSLFVGLGYHYDQWVDIRDELAEAGVVTPFVSYSRGYPKSMKSSGLSGNVLYDSRDNPINAKRGAFWNASLRLYNRGLGSDENWQTLWSDLRVYPMYPAASRHTIALWSTLWFVFGEAPYLNLPSVGWDTYGRSGRGYLQGRIRAVNQIYNEAEYRVNLRRDELLGAVAFINLTASSIPATGQFGSLDPGCGVGLRMKFNKRTATNITVDYAWAIEGSSNLYFGMQEVF